jgi:hypothetical protein
LLLASCISEIKNVFVSSKNDKGSDWKCFSRTGEVKRKGESNNRTEKASKREEKKENTRKKKESQLQINIKKEKKQGKKES